MSVYEQYSRTAGTYDASRSAVGIEALLGILLAGRTSLSHLRVLDAGCGTGNYAAAVRPYVSSVACLDANPEMLVAAEAKLGHDPGVSFHRATLPVLPFDAGSFDVVMCNQVIHHLDRPESPGFENHLRLFDEIERVLVPQGTAVFSTLTHTQLREGVWWSDLIDVAVDRMAPRFATLDEIEEAFVHRGFRPGARLVPTADVIQGDDYFKPESVLDESFRAGDSHWSLLSASELEDVLARMRGLLETGAAGAYVAHHDRRRPDVGQFTFVAFEKTGGR